LSCARAGGENAEAEIANTAIAVPSKEVRFIGLYRSIVDGI
jgi:hypothetical protein